MAIGATDFHQVYRKCFIESSSLSEEIDKVREEIPNLLLIDEGNREEKIIETIKKIRSILPNKDAALKDHPALLRLKLFSQSIQGSVTFWNTFSPAFPFENAPQVKTLFVNRIKSLQDDLQKRGIDTPSSLNLFFEDPEFFTRVKKSKPSSSTGYFKPGNDTPVSIQAAQKHTGHAEGLNWYSERSIEESFPNLASEIRTIRDSVCAKARRELITEQVAGVPNQLTGKIDRFILVPIDQTMAHPDTPYMLTVCALVYNAIKEGRVRSLEEAHQYGWEQLANNPILERDKNKNIDELELWTTCAQMIDIGFGEAFQSMQNLGSNQATKSEGNKSNNSNDT